ncbi:hypothetical protein NM688_g7825 [Phlebia brevispora]|uniref:Uncharacterized protein n=1 Tax=Phlebia brevispora TaxID=194682 RepID=A0ACC1S0Q5_9APHY|nr:hypothetical protein NM688_g7825 [Phlebia brevispora]
MHSQAHHRDQVADMLDAHILFDDANSGFKLADLDPIGRRVAWVAKLGTVLLFRIWHVANTKYSLRSDCNAADTRA